VEWSWLHVLWEGLRVTVKLSLITIACSVVLAALFAAASTSEWRALRWTTRFVVDLLT